jgi:TRAP-type C4-dicarboxylate transport system permease small subunit
MLERLTETILKLLRPLTVFLDRIAWVVVFLMMFYTVIDVLALKVVLFSLLGTVEMTALLMVTCVFFAFAQTELEDGHIRVDFIYNRLGRRTRHLCDFLTQLLGMVLFGCIGWAALLNGFEKRATGEVTMDLLIPIYPFAFAAAAGCCLISLSLLVKTLKALQRMVQS